MNLPAMREALVDMAILSGVKTRETAEAHLERVLKRALGAQYEAVVKQLGDPPDPNKLDAQFWDGLDTDLKKTMQAELEQVYLDAAEEAAADSVVGVDWGLVNRAAAEWAGQYAFERVKDIGDTTRAALREKIPAFFEEPTTIGALRDSLAALFGETRAQMIAVTETTRASVMGQRGTVGEIQAQGIQMQATWLTNEDETVCPICRPLNGKHPADDGLYHHPTTGEVYDMPPAHVNCRCNEAFRMVSPK